MAFNLTLNAAIKSDLTEIHPLLEQKKSVQMISPSFLEKIKGFDCISNLSSMKYFSFLASFGKLAYLDLSNKPL